MERPLNDILNEINTDLKTVSFGSQITAFVLCSQQTRDDQTFPVLNTGNGQGEIIEWDDKDDLRLYHRNIAPMEEESDPTQGVGANPSRLHVYFLRAVFIGTRKALTVEGFEDNENFARNIQNVFPTFLSGQEIVQVITMEVEKQNVYTEEYDGVKLKDLALDGIAFWINYTVKAKIC